jgi:hypothetical protein
MKKLLLSFAAICLLAWSFEAQSCIPGENFEDSTFGVWPDTTLNFPPAAANVAYSTDLNFKVPATVPAELSAQYAGSAIQSFTVTGVAGLPSGYNYACNIGSCTYAGGANGCANIWGTTATTGTYPITIELDATVMVSLIPGFPPAPFQVPGGVSFGGYKIIVGTAGLITSVVEPLSIYPTPSNGEVSIKGIVADELTITNLNGQVILRKNVFGQTQTNLDLSSLNAGVYFVNTLGALGKETIRFIKN